MNHEGMFLHPNSQHNREDSIAREAAIATAGSVSMFHALGFFTTESEQIKTYQATEKKGSVGDTKETAPLAGRFEGQGGSERIIIR
jgi:hypothetical protein